MEEKVCIRSGDLELEGLFESGRTTRGAVITHPHPLYGGNMHNPVVDAIRRAYRMKGVATLRFNFRGTGESEGQHDNGVGEQDDVLAALSFLTESGFQPVDVAGYSFGAWVNALTLQRGGPFRESGHGVAAGQVYRFRIDRKVARTAASGNRQPG